MNTEIEAAKAALDQARADHAQAMLERVNAPHSSAAQQRVRDAVADGRSAWKAYQKAATASLAAQIEAIVPSVFRE